MNLKHNLTTLKKSLARLKNQLALSKSVIAGFIGALILIVVIYHNLYLSVPQLGAVNINRLVHEHIEKRAKSALSTKELEADSRAFVEKLERSVSNLAKQKNLHLIISDVVVSNIKDYTDTIRHRLAEGK